MKLALLIPFHNRPDTFRKCLESLPSYPCTVILINDCSTDYETIEIANNFTLKGAKVELHNFSRNAGVKGALKYGYEYAFKTHDIVINLDSDCIVTPDFFTRILSLRAKHKEIISGFNSSDNKRNPIIEERSNYLKKRFVNGACLCVNHELYAKYIELSLRKPGNWDYNTSLLAGSCVVAKPSLVQHIGMVSSMGHSDNPDVALDFPKIKLPDVTLFGIDAHDPVGITRAAAISQRHIEFGDVRIITERLFKGREGYSRFCIKDMWKYVDTSHVLIVHGDGYVMNPWAWDDSWLGFDMIGANWDWYKKHTCGNGGFSLRSKKLLKIISELDLKEHHAEDDILCRQMRPMLEREHDIKFAPAEVCKEFSIEGYGLKPGMFKYDSEFGFHGMSVPGLPYPPLPKKK